MILYGLKHLAYHKAVLYFKKLCDFIVQCNTVTASNDIVQVLNEDPGIYYIGFKDV